MDTPKAVLVAGVVIALAILFVGRWQIAGRERLDRWTGTITWCAAGTDYLSTGNLTCGAP